MSSCRESLPAVSSSTASSVKNQSQSLVPAKPLMEAPKELSKGKFRPDSLSAVVLPVPAAPNTTYQGIWYKYCPVKNLFFIKPSEFENFALFKTESISSNLRLRGLSLLTCFNIGCCEVLISSTNSLFLLACKYCFKKLLTNQIKNMSAIIAILTTLLSRGL